MRLPMVSLLLVSVLLVGLTMAQDGSSEDSAAPKRVLKKYRVRRPVIVDDQGNVVRAGPRLRRVRVKNPRPTLETSAVVSPTPQIVTSTSVSSSTSPEPQPQILRQRTASPAANSIVNTPQRLQAQPVYFEEQGIVEQARTLPTYRQATSIANREALLANMKYKPSRGTSAAGGDEDRKVGTTRNYSKINEDGSFTFGYEAEDGSFKEETRGVDCVVRGKYGYIDPEGVRREFEYVSGNPCDPNDPNKEEQEEDEVDSLSPSRPLLRQRVRPEISENNIQQGLQQTVEERVPEDQLINFVRPAQRIRVRPNQPIQPGQIRHRVRITTPPPTYNQASEEPTLIVRQRPYQISSARPIYQEPSQSLDSDRPNSGRGFSFDSEVQRIAAISRPQNQPQPLYEQPFRQVQHFGDFGRQVFGNKQFHQEQAQQAQQAQQERVQPSPTPTAQTPNGRYRTELVYDPSSGQYTSVLVQSDSHTNQEFELTQKLRAFADPTPTPTAATTPTFQTNLQGSGAYTQIQQFGQPQIQYYHHPTQPQPQIPHGRSANPQPQGPQQDPSQINQFLARHAYRVQQDQNQNQQVQPQVSVSNLQFIPPHLRPGNHQTAEIQRQEVREINFRPSPSSSQPQQLSANSAQSTGQIDAFLRALNISI